MEKEKMKNLEKLIMDKLILQMDIDEKSREITDLWKNMFPPPELHIEKDSVDQLVENIESAKAPKICTRYCYECKCAYSCNRALNRHYKTKKHKEELKKVK